MRSISMAMLLVAACGGGGSSGPPAPTCQQSVGHYYSVGCFTKDANGTPYSEDQVRMACLDALAELPAQCRDELDDLRFCFNEATAGRCDCSPEQEALLTCE